MLKHIPSNTNTQEDALSRRTKGTQGKEDNNDIIVLPTEVFVKATSVSLDNIDLTC